MEIINKNIFLDKNKMEVSQNKQNEFKLINTMKKNNGHTLFSYNVITGEIKEAKIVRDDTISFSTMKPLIKDHVLVEPDCYYEQALNRVNFVKRLKRNGLYKEFISEQELKENKNLIF